MTEFVLDSEEELGGLTDALQGLAACDLPLVAEVLFVGEEEIRRLNRETRATDRVTDVLSFPAMELTPQEEILSEEHGECVDVLDDGREALFLGSVAVCTARAREQASEYGHSYARELNYLIVHGILHCLGYDHETEDGRRVMREKEEEVMQRLHLGREE